MLRLYFGLCLTLGFALSYCAGYVQTVCASPTPTPAQEKNNQTLIAQLRSSSTNGRSNAFIGVQYIPVKFHVITKSDGTGSVPLAAINQALAIANAYYSNANIQFYFAGAGVNIIQDNTFYNYSFLQENVLCTPNDVDNAINVYLPNTINYNSNNVTGYAYFPSQDKTSNRVFMANNGPFVKTFMHEIGHYFNLYHTFQDNQNSAISKRELVNRGAGANCATTGDFVCDTPADPYGLFGANVGSCIYTGTITDVQGNLFTPSLTNIMSYYSESCGNTFTAE